MNHSLIKLAIVAGILIGGLLLYAFFVPSPTIAAEPPSVICYTEAQLEQDAKAKGRMIVGGASYDGAETDESVIVQTATDVLIYGFRDGCYVGMTQLEPVATPRPDKGA